MSSLRKGAFYLLAGSAGQSILRVLFTAVLARLLTPEDFGLMATATIITGFAELFVQFGFGQGLIQKRDVSLDDIGTAYSSSLVLGLGFGLLILAAAPLISGFFSQPQLTPVLRWLSLLFPIKSFNQVQFSLLQKEKNFKALAGRDVVSYVIGYGVVGITMAYLNYSIWALVTAVIVQAVVYSILLGISQTKAIVIGYNKSSFYHLLGYGKNLTTARIYNYLALKGDYFIVSKILGLAALGNYSRAYGVMNMPSSLIGSVLNTVLFSEFSIRQNNHVHVKRLLDQSFKYCLRFTIPLIPLIIIYAEEVVLVLLGGQWVEAINPIRIMALGLSFRLLYKVSGAYLRIGELIVYQRKIGFVYMILVLVGSYVGSHFSINHVAAFITIALFLNFVFLTNKVCTVSQFSWKDFIKSFIEVLPIAVLLAVFGSGAKMISLHYDLPPLYAIILLVLICAGVIAVLEVRFPKYSFGLREFKKDLNDKKANR